MKKLPLAAAAIAAAALALAPSASADVEEFVYDVQSAGFNVTNDNKMYVLALGLGVCVDLYNGTGVGEVVKDAQDLGFKYGQATKLIGIAVADLCPTAPLKRGSA